MWPQTLDLTIGECLQKLREMEVDAYGRLVSVVRAKGGVSGDGGRLLREAASLLDISAERAKAEIRRVTSSELLATIAYKLTGKDWSYEWAEEGRRLVPLRLPPPTVNLPLADTIATIVASSYQQHSGVESRGEEEVEQAVRDWRETEVEVEGSLGETRGRGRRGGWRRGSRGRGGLPISRKRLRDQVLNQAPHSGLVSLPSGKEISVNPDLHPNLTSSDSEVEKSDDDEVECVRKRMRGDDGSSEESGRSSSRPSSSSSSSSSIIQGDSFIPFSVLDSKNVNKCAITAVKPSSLRTSPVNSIPESPPPPIAVACSNEISQPSDIIEVEADEESLSVLSPSPSTSGMCNGGDEGRLSPLPTLKPADPVENDKSTNHNGLGKQITFRTNISMADGGSLNCVLAKGIGSNMKIIKITNEDDREVELPWKAQDLIEKLSSCRVELRDVMMKPIINHINSRHLELVEDELGGDSNLSSASTHTDDDLEKIKVNGGFTEGEDMCSQSSGVHGTGGEDTSSTCSDFEPHMFHSLSNNTSIQHLQPVEYGHVDSGISNQSCTKLYVPEKLISD